MSWLSKKLEKIDVSKIIQKEIKKYIKKHDIKKFLIKAGDMAVKASPSKADDILWKQIKKFIKDAKI
jgi:hypothetical protein